MKRPNALWLIAFSVLALALASAVYFFTRTKDDAIRVPLGVEQAAIVTYSGPQLAVAPYKWGVAVNVRIAEVTARPDRRIYDLRYIVNREGTFDLKDYLTTDNGSALTGLPSFKFTGDPRLSKNLDNRIQETEEIRVDIGGYYYEILGGLTILWILWLLLLVFYKRPRAAAEDDAAPAGPTLAERMRSFLAQLEAGTLDATAKAKLEMALLQCWRNELALTDQPMSAALEQMSRSDKTRESLRRLQHWLHHPASSVSSSDIAAAIQPYTIEPAS